MAANSTVAPSTNASPYFPAPPLLSAPATPYFYYPAYTYQNGSFHIVPNYFMPPPPIYSYPHNNWPMPPDPYAQAQQVQGSYINSQTHKPEESKYQCRSCDRGYRTQFKYNEHIAQHVKCPAENCNYSAIESLVEFHYKWQHVTGLASKCWGNTPDEIEEWRINRRKNFPTEIKILKKKEQKAKLAQKYAASRVIYEKKAQLSNNYTSQSANNNFSRNNNQYSNARSTNNFNDKYSTSTSKFQGRSNGNSINNIDNSASSSLNGPNHSNLVNSNLIIRKYRQRSLKYLARAVNNKLPLGTETSQWRRKYTLLERLLAPEIKAERELILKCVKYVSKNILPSLSSHQSITN